ncbi:MAG: ParB/Srx family N-terminal domain-containing protein [Candidatus Thorarchaeota archaeon]
MKNSFEMELSKIQPSQLYISKKKLAKVKEKFNPKDLSTLEVIPIKKIDNEIFYTDGHTRAFAAYQAGHTKIPVIWEDEELDWELYKKCIKWCKDLGVYSIADLSRKVINHKDYEILWYKRCEDLHKKIAKRRKQKNISKNTKIPS